MFRFYCKMKKNWTADNTVYPYVIITYHETIAYRYAYLITKLKALYFHHDVT